MNYFKLLRFLQKGDKGLFDIPVEEQRLYLTSLGEAKNDFDRGFKQYLCQNLFVPKWKSCFLNLAAAILVPIIVLWFLVKRVILRKEQNVEALIEDKGMSEVVPLIVRDKYNPESRYWKQGASMSLSDILFLLKLVLRAAHHPYFVLKAWMNVAEYSDMIYRHSPKVLIQFGEFSFSSSILTAYCHRHGIKHVDIMHGEKLFFIRDAFFHYDECYVWSDYYVDLFKSLKAEPTQFLVALPPSMLINAELFHNMDFFADYKYYLALYNEEQIKSIVGSMAFAKNSGKIVKFRPHPRYSDFALLKKYVKEEEIEYPREVSIEESVSNLSYAVGSYTTVLSQTWFSGKEVILDDVTFIDQYIKLDDYGYILSKMNCRQLSDLQNDEDNNTLSC